MVKRSSNKLTAAAARDFLCRRDPHFRKLNGPQKLRLVVAFARRGIVVYGQAFDLVHCEPSLDFNDEAVIERARGEIRLYEVKSSSRTLKPGFADYFFSFSTAELLVAQSLGDNYRFAFVNIHSGECLDLSLREVFGRARAIYPSWSIKF
jgi:hypothetical protein